MNAIEAAQEILRMLEELPFYDRERQALQFAVVALHEKVNRDRKGSGT